MLVPSSVSNQTTSIAPLFQSFTDIFKLKKPPHRLRVAKNFSNRFRALSPSLNELRRRMRILLQASGKKVGSLDGRMSWLGPVRVQFFILCSNLEPGISCSSMIS